MRRIKRRHTNPKPGFVDVQKSRRYRGPLIKDRIVGPPYHFFPNLSTKVEHTK